MELTKKAAKEVKELKRKYDQKKAYKKIKRNLESNPELLQAQKVKFEKAFGVDQESRTRKQWIRLVNTYGMKTVCESEKMTEEEVRRKCSESFAQKRQRTVRERTKQEMDEKQKNGE